MIEKLAERLVRWLNSRGIVDRNDISAYRYGAATLIYTVVSTTALIALGVIAQRVGEALSIISIFYINQTTGGGYHASSHMRCFATMMIGLISCLVFCGLSLPIWVVSGMLVVSYATLLCIPVVLHPNKQYLMERRALLKKRSRRTTAIQAVIVAVLCGLSETLLYACTFGAMASAVSRIVGWYRLERQPC